MNKPTTSHLRKLGLLFFVFSLTACSSGPEHVTASRPLVENVQYSNNKSVPEQFWLDLDTRKEEFLFVYKGASVTVGEAYLSALGNICRPITAQTDLNIDKRVVCRNDRVEGWHLTPDIILMESNEFSF
ncbi:hypothetical protein [Vibrio atypicus]|uniref:hypothetical protein n=1 Tax=Vibrio atypicus TaxID=558271 RepID=UPI003737071D